MTTQENAQFANSLGALYQGIAQQMGTFLHANIDTMTQAQINILGDDQGRVLSFSNTFLTLSDKIAFANSDACFAAITQATAGINTDIKKIDNINKWITVAAGVITMGAAIVSGNLGGVGTGLESVVTALKS